VSQVHKKKSSHNNIEISVITKKKQKQKSIMKVFGRFRRNVKNSSSRTPTQEEVNANLDIEGNPNAKLQPNNESHQHTGLQSHQGVQSQQQQQQQIQVSQAPRSSNSSKNNNNAYDNQTDEFIENDGDYNLMVDGKPVYIVKQKRGYLSILFSLTQTGILIAMMVQCGVAPMSINRKFFYQDSY
jgi:hypothetical protein